MAVKQVTASTVKEGDTILIGDAPCKVMSVQKSKPGKHGSAKARIVGVGVIDEKKRDVVMPGHEIVSVPIVEKKTAQVLSTSGDMANVMDMETYETFDIKIPEDLKGKLQDGMQVLYWILMEQKLLKQIKEGNREGNEGAEQ